MGARTLAFQDGAEVSPGDDVLVYPVWHIPAGRFPETPPPWSAPGVFCVAPDGVAVLARECWPRLPDYGGERIEGFTIERVESAHVAHDRVVNNPATPAVNVAWLRDHPPPLRALCFTFGLYTSERLGGNPAQYRFRRPMFGTPGNYTRAVRVGAEAAGLAASHRFGIALSAGDIVVTNVRTPGGWELAVVV